MKGVREKLFLVLTLLLTVGLGFCAGIWVRGEQPSPVVPTTSLTWVRLAAAPQTDMRDETGANVTYAALRYGFALEYGGQYYSYAHCNMVAWVEEADKDGNPGKTLV